jgi:hypothetical protein
MRVYQPFIRSSWRFLVCVKQNGGIIPAVLFFCAKNRAKSHHCNPALAKLIVFG